MAAESRFKQTIAVVVYIKPADFLSLSKKEKITIHTYEVSYIYYLGTAQQFY